MEVRPEDWEHESLDNAPDDEVGECLVPWATEQNVHILPVDWWIDGAREEAAIAEKKAASNPRW